MKCWICRKKVEEFYLTKVEEVSWPLSDIKVLCKRCFKRYRRYYKG